MSKSGVHGWRRGGGLERWGGPVEGWGGHIVDGHGWPKHGSLSFVFQACLLPT